jgi:hypothetical protein
MKHFIEGGSHMEKILRCIGDLFLNIANAISEAKNTADSFLFDILLEGDDFNETKSPYHLSTNGITSEPRNKL